MVMPQSLAIGNRAVPMPRTKAGRITLGSALVLGGTVGFLPVVGFWMLPLGVMVLAQDIAAVRRFRRRCVVKWYRWRAKRAAASRH